MSYSESGNYTLKIWVTFWWPSWSTFIIQNPYSNMGESLIKNNPYMKFGRNWRINDLDSKPIGGGHFGSHLGSHSSDKTHIRTPVRV